MAAPCSLDVEISGICAVEVVHDLRKVVRRSFKKKVIMVVHHAKCVNNCIVPLIGSFKILKKFFAIPLAFENGFTIIASGSDMVKCPWKYYSQRSSHSRVRFL
jgi:hypothetical protein